MSGITFSFKNFPRLVMIHTVKGFSVISEAEVGFFFNSLAFSMIQRMLAVSSLIALPFLNQLVDPEVLGSHTVEA